MTHKLGERASYCADSGPEDPVWHEYPERLQRANAVFRGEKP